MPLGPKFGRESINRKINNKSGNISKDYLTTKQANYVCRKVELENLINKSMMRLGVYQDIEIDKMGHTSGEENPYRELIVNNAK